MIDDDEDIRVSLRLIIDAEPDMVVVAEADRADRGADVVARLVPDVVIVDVRMPCRSGIDAAATIRARAAAATTGGKLPAVLFLTAIADDTTTRAAFSAGARGFLVKGLGRHELIAAIRAVARGDAVLAHQVTDAFIDSALREVTQDDLNGALLDRLTERERELVQEIGLGLSNAEIAERMVLTPNSVKTYVSRVLEKLEVTNRTQLAIIAYRTGLLDGAAR